MEKALEALRQKSLSMVAENLEYFNCCKKEFAVSECKLWINKIFDRVNEELEEAMKPKSCAICKQFKEHNRYQVGICEKGHADSTRGGLYTVDYDFCCNRYEAKEK